jgi:hypothetical protein
MDPFIEGSCLWGDFQSNLIFEVKVALAANLPDQYLLRMRDRAYIVRSHPGRNFQERGHSSDGFVGARSSAPTATVGAENSSVASYFDCELAPISIAAMVETEYREVFLELRQSSPPKKLVTCIEILSPANERSGTKGWRLYNRKRTAYLGGHAHFVEIDLLSGGRRLRMAGNWPASPYYLLVCRKHDAPMCKVWPAFFTRPLPRIDIPLLAPDPDIALDLQPLIEKIYRRSRYERDIDYTQPIDPPMDPAETAWLQERLHERRESQP